MDFVLTIDTNFAPQGAACIASICENNKTVPDLSFHILTTGIKREAAEKLQNLVSSYNRTLSIIDIGNIYKYFSPDFDTSGWNEIVLARLLMARFLPETISRVLYLDGDTIVRGSLRELWETDMQGCALGAVREPTASIAQRELLQIADMRYFNAGVLLVDLSTWREQGIERRLLEYCEVNRDKLFANDQDAINGCLAGQIYELSPKYNYVNSFYYYTHSALTKMCRPAPYLSKIDYSNQTADPVIVHFLGEERPWRKGNTHRYRTDYQRYLQLTPLSGTPLEEGWETYFLVWRAFNTITKPFPMLRYKIISSLIPAFMRFRSRQRKKDSKA